MSKDKIKNEKFSTHFLPLCRKRQEKIICLLKSKIKALKIIQKNQTMVSQSVFSSIIYELNKLNAIKINAKMLKEVKKLLKDIGKITNKNKKIKERLAQNKAKNKVQNLQISLSQSTKIPQLSNGKPLPKDIEQAYIIAQEFLEKIQKGEKIKSKDFKEFNSLIEDIRFFKRFYDDEICAIIDKILKKHNEICMNK